MADAADTLLEARGLSAEVGYGTGERRTLFTDLSLMLSVGDVVDLIGPSGSGKTTLLCALARMQPASQGTLVLEGTPSGRIPVCDWRSRVALLPQQASFAEGDVRGNLLVPFSLKVRADRAAPDDGRMRGLLDDVGLEDIELDRDVARLSGGQRARVALCRTLLTEPRVLLLDEVDAALDSASVQMIGATVASYVASTHTACIRIRHREADAYTTRRLTLSDGVLEEEVL